MDIDPLAEKYKRFNPYMYGGNNPIKFIDPDGRHIIISYGQGENKVDLKYNENGKLYNARTGAEFKDKNTYVQGVQKNLNNLRKMGGEVAKAINNLMAAGSKLTISRSAPPKTENAAGSFTVKDGSDNSYTKFAPDEDKASDKKNNKEVRSETEVLGHEIKHAYNNKNKIDNSRFKVTDTENKDANGNPKTVRGEEVDAVNFQNVIRNNEGKSPLTTYTGVDISSKLVNPCEYKINN